MSSVASTSGGGSVGGGPCGACKFLRRKCVAGCIFAPYFDSDRGATHFAAVHKVFGASNVSKLLCHLPIQKRHDAVMTICYEAQARLRDPVYGCVSHIFALQQQVANLQVELAYLQAHLATIEGPTPTPLQPPSQPQLPASSLGLSIIDLPTSSTIQGTYDLSSLLEPAMPPLWTMQPQRTPMDPGQFIRGDNIRSSDDLPQAQGSACDLQELATELLHKPCKSEGPPLPPHDNENEMKDF